MADYPPYINAYGTIGKALDKLKTAEAPPRVSQDFVSTVLGIKGGSGKAVIPYLKRIGFVNPDGSPSELYKQFRNPVTGGQAMAKAMRHGYPQIYARNEYAHDAASNELQGYVVEITGLPADSSTVRAIVKSFETLKKYANFTGKAAGNKAEEHQQADKPAIVEPEGELGFKMNLGYTINLNLPETTNVAVYDAIFRSLRENMLRK